MQGHAISDLYTERKHGFHRKAWSQSFIPRRFSSVVFLILKSLTLTVILVLQITEVAFVSILAFTSHGSHRTTENSLLLALNSNFSITMSKLKLPV